MQRNHPRSLWGRGIPHSHSKWFEHFIAEFVLFNDLQNVLSNWYAILSCLNYKKQFQEFQSLWSDHIESVKKNNNIRFLSILFPLKSFYNNISAVYSTLLKIKKDIENGKLSNAQRDTMAKRITIVRNWILDGVTLFVGCHVLDLLAIGHFFQNELGSSTIDGCDTVTLLNDEKIEMLEWVKSTPLKPGKNCNAMANLVVKFDFNEKNVICKTFGEDGIVFDIGKDKLCNEIAKMSQKVYEIAMKFYDKNISNKMLKIFEDIEACFDWKRYSGYNKKNMLQTTMNSFEKLAKPLVEEMKTPKPDECDVKPVIDATLALTEYESMQKIVLFPNRLKNQEITVGERVELIYQYTASTYGHKYPNVLRLLEWYTGLKMHMIDNERLNSKKTWILSSYRTNMSNDMLCAILRLQYGKDRVTSQLFHNALRLWLNKKNRRRAA